MQDPLWQLESVNLTSGGHTRLRDVSLFIQPGVTAVLGESGAGKTSLLNLLVGSDKPTSGTVRNCKQDAKDRGEGKIGRPPLFWVPQDHGLWPHLSAADHLTMVFPDALVDASIDASTKIQPSPTIDDLLHRFDLSKRRDAKPAQLSLGERARLSVARALATQARVIVMDEPMAHVDAARAPRFWQVIAEEVQRIAASWIFATHEPETVLAHAQHVITLDAGSLLSNGDVTSLYHSPPSEPAARCLGEINWMSIDEAEQWLASTPSNPATDAFGIRPEQLQIKLDPAGPLAVESFVFRGPTSHVQLNRTASNEGREFAVRSPNETLKRGDRVMLIDLRRTEGVSGD